MLNARFLAMPAVALAVIVALAQAHGTGTTRTDTPSVHRAVNCATVACDYAGAPGVVR
jgi:hypothetical protein